MGIFWYFFFTAILLLLLLFFYLYWKNVQDRAYFESHGVKYFGNAMLQLFLIQWKGIAMADNVKIQTQKMKNEGLKFAGVSQFGTHTLQIIDPELIKQVLVKDFHHFADRRSFELLDSDKCLRKMLTMLVGEEWKLLRSKMSPTFTTGKIKRMFQVFDTSAKKLVTFVQEQMDKSSTADPKAKGHDEIDITLAYSKLTMDVIASATCNIDSQAFATAGTSIFEEHSQNLQMKFGGLQMLKFMLMILAPKIADYFGLTFFGNRKTIDFFSNAIKGSIHHREEHGEVREDFIQLLMEARKGQLKVEESELDRFEKEAIIANEVKTEEDGGAIKTTGKMSSAELLDDDGIVANCLLFIFAGFDTTQSLLIFAAYALAIYPEVQKKLRAELETVLEDGEFTYDSVAKMTYFDMFISETLRCYSPALVTERACTKDWPVPGTTLTLPKGQTIAIPILGLHHDPEYYPEPERFIPERFSPSNRANMNPYAYLPFGHGPRNCLGMRFALMEVKLAIGHLVMNFDIQPSTSTPIPVKHENSVSLKPVGGMWLSLKKRDGSKLTG